MALHTSVRLQRDRGSAQPWLTRPMLVTLLLLASYPLWAERVGLYPYLGIEVAIWMLYGLGYNLLLGYTGLPAFGHGAFLGVGAYAYGLCYLAGWQNPLLCLALGALAGGVAAGLVGALVARRRGIYFALLTIACGQVFWFVAIKAHSLTGGEDGLLNIRRPALGGLTLADDVALYYLVLVALAAAIVALWRLLHSPLGMALQAIRMNEARARCVGYDVARTQWTVMALSGFVAGLAGSLLTLAQESAYPDVMSLHSSGFIVMAVLIGGGTVSFWGPVLGALVFILARDLLGAVTSSWPFWYGLLFMGVVLFQPEGIAGAWQRYRHKLRSRVVAAAASSNEGPRGAV